MVLDATGSDTISKYSFPSRNKAYDPSGNSLRGKFQLSFLSNTWPINKLFSFSRVGVVGFIITNAEYSLTIILGSLAVMLSGASLLQMSYKELLTESCNTSLE